MTGCTVEDVRRETTVVGRNVEFVLPLGREGGAAGLRRVGGVCVRTAPGKEAEMGFADVAG